MQLRREQKEEQATETEIVIYETEQQQEQKIKDAARKGRRSRNLVILLSGSANG
jgi:hypothetical protein